MVRVTTARRAAERDLLDFISERCKSYALSGNYCMAADYALRWLDKNPRSADALALGSVLGQIVGQPTLSEKCMSVLNSPVASGGLRARCNEAAGGVARRITQPKYVGGALPNVWSHVTPTMANVVRSVSLAAGEEPPQFEHILAGSSDVAETPIALPPPGIETLSIGSSLDLPIIQSLLTEACWASTTGGSSLPVAASYECPISVVAPEGSTFGRGLFASGPLKSGDVLLEEEAVLSINSLTSSSSIISGAGKRSPIQLCFHCGERISGKPVECAQHCQAAAYCTDQCEEQARVAFHSQTCEARNPSYCHWEGQIAEDCRRPLEEAFSELRALTPQHVANTSVRHLMRLPEVQRESGESIRAHLRHAHSALTMLGVGRLCAIAANERRHPLSLPGLALLTGKTEYSTEATLIHTGALAVGLSGSLNQPHLYLDDVVSMYALLQTNGFFNALVHSEGILATLHLFPLLSLLNHSCIPNCRLERYNANTPRNGNSDFGSGQRLVTMRDVKPGEQLFINYNDDLITPSASYQVRRELLEQRGFMCTCDRCIMRK